MNSNCPTCGALYNVAAKDIGRRLKCKKCSAALTVTEAGLVVDDGTEPALAPSRSAADETEEPVVKKRRPFGPGFNPLRAIGGVPGLLFGTGVFLVLFFTFLQVLAAASNQRAIEYEKKLALEEEVRLRKLLPKGKKDRSELTGDDQKKYDDDKKKIEDEYIIPKKEADEDKRGTEIGNKRSRLYEGYGVMFGFMLVSVGCLGFLLTEQLMLLRIIAGIILVGLVLGLFRLAIGTGAGFGAGISLG